MKLVFVGIMSRPEASLSLWYLRSLVWRRGADDDLCENYFSKSTQKHKLPFFKKFKIFQNSIHEFKFKFSGEDMFELLEPLK